MRIGGITWWRNNYGSLLQAYALQIVLDDIPDVEYEIINQYGRRIASFDNLVLKIKKVGILNSCRRIIFRFGLKKMRNRTKRLQEFIDNNLCISKEQYTEQTIHNANEIYDGFVCGSDQIWNPSLETLESMYWLGFVDEGKFKFSYAPSIGVSDLDDENKIIIQKNLKDFKAISCRESSGSKLLNSFLRNRCYTVLDPTMLIDRKIWDDKTSTRIIEKPYLFAYMLRGSKQQRKYIERMAKRKGLIVVTMPFLEAENIVWYDALFGDIKVWDASPFDFISLIRYSELIFTDSFHCIIFSILYHRRFFCFPKKGKNQMNRLNDLHSMFYISNRIINDTDSAAMLERVPEIDWNTVDSILDNKRKESYEYLKRAICE